MGGVNMGSLENACLHSGHHMLDAVAGRRSSPRHVGVSSTTIVMRLLFHRPVGINVQFLGRTHGREVRNGGAISLLVLAVLLNHWRRRA